MGRGNESDCDDARLSRGGGRRCGLTAHISDNSKNNNNDDDDDVDNDDNDDDMLVSCFSQLL